MSADNDIPAALAWLVPDWPAPAQVRAYSTTLRGGVSEGPYASLNLATHVGDDPRHVAENRRRLQRSLQLPAVPHWLQQVRGITAVDAAAVQRECEADASHARRRDVVCAVLTADCLPVLLCDRGGTVVAAVHAGWRGLLDGVIENTVRAMQCPGADLMAWLGPAIGPDAFEVGAEVRTAFIERDGAAAFLLCPEWLRTRRLPHFISYAIGALLGAAFLALLPHALESPAVEGAHGITMTVLGGVLVFFLLEKMVLWRHCHSNHCEAHDPPAVPATNKATGTIVMVGDTVHNFVDGILIGAAVLTDFHLGVVTALAVATHEIPQELGDFAVLLHSGFSRGAALLFNSLSGLATVAGGVIAYYGLKNFDHILPYALAVAASSFIYVAVADLIPGLHKRRDLAATGQQVSLITAGVLTIYLVHGTLHCRASPRATRVFVMLRVLGFAPLQ